MHHTAVELAAYILVKYISKLLQGSSDDDDDVVTMKVQIVTITLIYHQQPMHIVYKRTYSGVRPACLYVLSTIVLVDGGIVDVLHSSFELIRGELMYFNLSVVWRELFSTLQ